MKISMKHARIQIVDKFLAMQAFIRVVESGTFTKAAQMLDLPKTAVSRLIASLEVERSEEHTSELQSRP